MPASAHLAPPTHPSLSRTPSPSTSPSIYSNASSVNVVDPSLSTETLEEVPAEEISDIPTDEDELSEVELRRLYDDEEIDRFLGLFADYVSEVTVSDASVSSPTSGRTEVKADPNTSSLHLEEEEVSLQPDGVEGPNDSDGGKLPVDGPAAQIPSETLPSPSRTLAETIALSYLLPVLPPARPKPERFTLGRVRLTIQRLYLVAQPAYGSLFSRLARLATWKDRKQSAFYCTAFWTLWLYNLLLPALFLRIIYSLIRRKIFPYPTVEELRERRREVAKAEEFGEQIQTRLSASSASGVMEAWRLFRVFVKPKKNKAKQKKTKAKETAKNQFRNDSTDEVTRFEQGDEAIGEATVLDDPLESPEENDMKKEILIILNEIVDLHERVKNVFLWRRPTTSRLYLGVLTLLFIVTYFLPVKYLAKLTTMIGGLLFWHITPIIAALPSADRSRLPPAFGDAPTDADYAMELISQRVARGENVRPPPRKPKKAKKRVAPSASTTRLESTEEPDEDGQKPSADRHGEVDWRKWGDKAAMMKSWADQGKRLIGKGQSSTDLTRGPSEPSSPQNTGQTEHDIAPSTFLAQYNALPGIITITNTTLLFTPITSSKAKLRIELADIRGVKKTGAMKGLVVRWQSRTDGDGKENVERFMWVGGRDEVFAHLVGWGGRRWLKV